MTRTLRQPPRVHLQCVRHGKVGRAVPKPAEPEPSGRERTAAVTKSSRSSSASPSLFMHRDAL